MQLREYQGKPLRYLVVEPDGYDPGREYPLVVLLHGFGAHMGDLASICPAIDPGRYLYVCPNAPIPMQVGPAAVGYAWTPPRGSGTAEDAQRAEDMLGDLLEEVLEQRRVEPGRVVLGGFSQGGMMSYRWGLTNPDLFRGLVVLSSRVPDPDALRARLPAVKEQHIFIAHGASDPLIPVEDARQSRQFLEAQGYRPQYREYQMGHQITEEVLEDLAPWVRNVLSPDDGPEAGPDRAGA